MDFDTTTLGDLQLITLPARGQVLRFGSLSFIANVNDDLKLGDPTTPHIISVDIAVGDTSLDVDADTIAHCINSYLGPNPPREEIETMLYVLVNIFFQLTVGGSEPMEEHGREARLASLSG